MIKGLWNRTADLLEKPLKIGAVIQQRYDIRKILGRGSYGTSYLAWDQLKQQSAVLKILRLHQRITKSGKAAFAEEQKLLDSLNHPFFPAFFEKGDIDGIPFFTMEYVSGKTFEQLIFEEGKTYGEKEAFQIGIDLLTIINWLHKHGIVHRDIRIPNVMLQDDQLRLIDFGLARRFQEGISKPIDLNQIKKVLSPISDFYALGHFLLFLLYSTFEEEKAGQEKSWEEELQLSQEAHSTIRRLLAIDEPYVSCLEIDADFRYILTI